jgi:hypothetical protein
MSDTDFFRYYRDDVVAVGMYSSLKNARSGVTYAKKLDAKYADRWPEKYGPGRVYVIQQLTAQDNELVWEDLEEEVYTS